MDCTAQEILDKMSACQQQLKDFKAQLVNVANRKSEIVSRLQSLVNETHPHHEVLMTIFNRKVKRVRKSAAEDEDDDDDEEDDDGDDDDDLSDEDTPQETCPNGCDQALYEEVPLLLTRCAQSCCGQWSVWDHGYACLLIQASAPE